MGRLRNFCKKLMITLQRKFMAKIHLNSAATAALQQIIGKEYLMPMGGDVVTGDKGDETIIVQYNYSSDKAEAATLVISPNGVYAQTNCALNADGSQVVNECEDLSLIENNGGTAIQPTDKAAALAFIAAIDSSEIMPNHRGSLDQTKVAEFKKMMGL
jgi:hypothetical protein